MDEGINKIQRAVRGRKVLIVFDGLNDLDQFNAILGMRESFYPGRKIIITTRLHENISKARDQVPETVKVEGLDSLASLKLFCWHAFKQDYHVRGYQCYIASVIAHCGGNPLALQVLASSLFGKTLEAWKSAVQNLSLITGDPRIQNNLKLTFSSLSDHDKRLFLHVACFFIGKDMDFTAIVLDSCDFLTRFGIQNLVDKCLVEVGLDNKLFMHPLLRDMGMGIICKQSPEYPGKLSRVWQKDASNILRKLTGTETI
ncbi:disease resistance protein RPV1-like [Malus sylvestris]|uniref:disease resistance protein RPV1-like n=1 Tax=Malus sylvestris TaxID=3752 RepID=UPI0021ABBA75|nr:disease resistance protein RPV1-like [Malus sylvestris]